MTETDPKSHRLKVTPEMRQAVADEQCDLLGHDVTPVMVYGQTDPVAVRCDRCNRQWDIEVHSGP